MDIGVEEALELVELDLVSKYVPSLIVNLKEMEPRNKRSHFLWRKAPLSIQLTGSLVVG